MFIDPKRVMFESQKDVIDYVSGGILPPSKSQFEEMINRVRNPLDSTKDTTSLVGNDVIITDKVVPDDEKEMLDKVLRRVYENRVKRRNAYILIGVLAGVALWYKK